MINKKQPSDSKLFVINASSSVATRLIQITALVWVNQYLLRRIAPEEYAIYPVILSLMVAGEIFSKIFTGGVTRFIVERDASDDQAGVSKVVSSMVPLLVLASLTIAALGMLALWRIGDVIKVAPQYVDDARLIMAMLTVTTCASIITTPFVSGLYVRQKFVIINIIDLASEILRVVIMVALLYGVSTRVLWVVLASMIASFFNLSVRRYFSKKELPSARFNRKLVHLETAKEIVKFGAWTSTSGLTNLLSRTGPFMLLNHFSNALETTVFNLGRLIDLNLKKIAQAASMPMQPALVRRFAKEGLDGLKSVYYRGGRYQLWILMFIVPPLIVFRQEVVILYVGEKYVTAGDVMLFYFLTYPFNHAGAMFYRVAHACGKVGEFFKIQLITTVVSFLIMVLLVAFYDMGAVGVSMAAFVTAVIMNVGFMWPRGLRMVAGTAGFFIDKILWRGCLPCVLSVCVCWLLRILEVPDTWMLIFAYSAVSAIVYLATMYFICMDSSDQSIVDRFGATLRKKVRQRFSRSSPRFQQGG